MAQFMTKSRKCLVIIATVIFMLVIANVYQVRNNLLHQTSDDDVTSVGIPDRLPVHHQLEESDYIKGIGHLGNQCPEMYSFPAEILQENKSLNSTSEWIYKKSKSKYNYKIVILTPISNYAENIIHYFRLVCHLSYPHHLISLVLGEDSSTDETLNKAKTHAKNLQGYFHSVEVVHFNIKLAPHKKGKHDQFYQRTRRAHLAQARNRLLFAGIRDADYVLWLDVDIKFAPSDLIQHLLAAGSDITAASCMYRDEDIIKPYDLNSWQETERSINRSKNLKEDDLLLEGYSETMRLYLPNIKNQGYKVGLDGVGGCALLIIADAHRQGLIFPTFVFKNHIETEALAKMAKKMGFKVSGLPFVYVLHW